jgi:ABC-type phosphate transport system permease subunit
VDGFRRDRPRGTRLELVSAHHDTTGQSGGLANAIAGTLLLVLGVLLLAGTVGPIAVGETAPLLYTVGWSASYPTGQLLGSPVGFLTYPIWTFYNFALVRCSATVL